jgi:SAM-dependent methyltransferase
LQAFDRLAAGYVEGWGNHPLARLLRARVIARCAASFPAGARVLDLGCGPGLDSAILSALGYDVVSVDASDGMVREARARGVAARRLDVEDLGDLAAEGPFAGALSNFGVLNCLPSLVRFGEGLARCLAPGAPAILVPMAASCPAETLALLARGRRPRRGRVVPVGTAEVPVRYLWAREVARELGDAFHLERVEALGVLVAPPDLGGRPGWRTALEPFVARAPWIRERGDHTLLQLRRR